jgi:hypothetical protein
LVARQRRRQIALRLLQIADIVLMAAAPDRSRLPRRYRGHYYSVPYRLLKEQVEVRITKRTVELFHKGGRVACHVRSGIRGRHTTRSRFRAD